ncbi:hypothetical protein [Leucobacter soli]|uniref:hypothetical protein n=1 Tax=Leucobacter soli TaxID=2812850 RepID=UPI00360F84B0
MAERDGAEAIIWGCTLIAAAYERAVLQGRPETSQVAIINPNVVAVKVAEMFADMQAVGQYRMSRKSYYQPQSHHDQESADQIAALLGVDPVI